MAAEAVGSGTFLHNHAMWSGNCKMHRLTVPFPDLQAQTHSPERPSLWIQVWNLHRHEALIFRR